MRLSILLPEDEQSDAGLLELDRKIGPVRLRASPCSLLDAVAAEKLVLKRIVGQFARQGPGQSNCCRTLQVILHRAARYPQNDCYLAGARPASGKPKHLSQLSHGQPSLRRHQNLPVYRGALDAKVADPGGNLQCRKLAGL
ncbi:hypothetical protein MPL1032_180098 [Mesorhizobium plurifarium]|uniref:Uncharacterized protein n=1 Tax=Mesorhizobium plurifarium TaxID=69974 RepID=A0A0K2VTH2_MESPL|nr:hypothetical protein MPL1032_180098 [Mesorhizobium plurifarium]